MKQQDRRKCPRHGCGAVIQYAFTEKGAPFAVRTIDFSEYGMGFITGYELQPGKTIHLTNRKTDEEQWPCAAEVVYCIPDEEKTAFSYRVGVRFDERDRLESCRIWRDDMHECKLP
jgi:hypothetical protein